MTPVMTIMSEIGQLKRWHDSLLREKCGVALTLAELNIVGFLYHNPEKDTAADIVALRGLSKGNVSQAVERLIARGMLQRRPDTADRRVVHLELLAAAQPVALATEAANAAMRDELLQGVSQSELEQLEALMQKFSINIQTALERRHL